MAVQQYSDPITNMLLQMRQSLDADSERRRAAFQRAVTNVTHGMRDAEMANARKEALALTGAEGQAYDKAHPLAAPQEEPGMELDPNQLTDNEDEAVSDELGLLTDDEAQGARADDEMNQERDAVDSAARDQRADAESSKTKNAVDAASAKQELDRASSDARRDVDLADFMRSYNTGYPTLMGRGMPVPEELPPNPYTRDRDGIVTTSEMTIYPQGPSNPATWSPEKRAMMEALTRAATDPYGGAPPRPAPAPNPMVAQLAAIPTAQSVPPSIMPQLTQPAPMAMSPAMPPQYGIAEYMRDRGVR